MAYRSDVQALYDDVIVFYDYYMDFVFGDNNNLGSFANMSVVAKLWLKNSVSDPFNDYRNR